MKTLRYIVFAAIALGFAACEQEDFNSVMQDGADAVKINATIGNMQTRVTYGDNGATNFTNGDAIKVVNTLRTSKHEATYTTTDGTNWTTSNAFVWNGGADKNNQFNAWYPVADYSSYENFRIPTEQSDVTKLASADWMTASTEAMAKPADQVLNLNFEHRLTKVTVKIANWGTEYEGWESITDVKIYSKTSQYPDATDDLVAVTPLQNGETEFTAIVAPMAYRSTDQLMTFTVVETDNLTVFANNSTLTSGLEPGKHYTFSLKVGKDVVGIENVVVTDWTEEEIDGGVAEEIPFLTFSAEEEQTFMVVDRTYSIEVSLQYSVNNGAWADYVFTTAEPFAIAFGGENGNLRLRGKNIAGTGTGDSDCISFSFGNPNVMVSCNGDIRTLVDWEAYTTVSTAEAQFVCLFRDCTVLISAPELPATTLAEDCYYWMFLGCTSLTDAPVLPATTLSYGCYACMFEGCTSLTQAPELPATVLAEACYELMFEDCTSLTQAPELPATILMPYCYSYMFLGCSSLTTSPVLPAPTLVERCYSGMFKECTLLNHITMLATDISANRCLSGWVDGVASTGTFIKAEGLDQGTESGQIPTNKSGIPSGWTVKNYGE